MGVGPVLLPARSSAARLLPGVWLWLRTAQPSSLGPEAATTGCSDWECGGRLSFPLPCPNRAFPLTPRHLPRINPTSPPIPENLRVCGLLRGSIFAVHCLPRDALLPGGDLVPVGGEALACLSTCHTLCLAAWRAKWATRVRSAATARSIPSPRGPGKVGGPFCRLPCWHNPRWLSCFAAPRWLGPPAAFGLGLPQRQGRALGGQGSCTQPWEGGPRQANPRPAPLCRPRVAGGGFHPLGLLVGPQRDVRPASSHAAPALPQPGLVRLPVGPPPLAALAAVPGAGAEAPAPAAGSLCGALLGPRRVQVGR